MTHDHSQRGHRAAKVACLATLALGAVLGCSADPERDSRGSCSLSCSQPRVAASNYIVRALAPATAIAMACVANFGTASIAPLNGPVQIKYQVLEKTKAFTGGKGAGNSSGGGSAAAGGGGAAGLIDPEDIEVPRGGIGFEPWVSGILAVENTSPEFVNPDKTVTPFKFAGVVTPSSEWCSDTCGVVSFEIWPNCVEGQTNNISAGVIVGGVKVQSFYQITVQNQQDATTSP